MRVRLLLGPAGSGKTFRCTTEAQQILRQNGEGVPLVILAPKQTTYQLERQLLSTPGLAGYTRLHILSFERLAHFVFDQLRKPAPRLLDEEGRIMVLRGLLARRRDALKLFRASARLTGFARELSLVLGEFQRHQLPPERIQELAQKAQGPGLAYKLEDLATLLREYLAWLAAHSLQDAPSLLDAATRALDEESSLPSPMRVPSSASASAASGRRARKISPDGQLDLLAGLQARPASSVVVPLRERETLPSFSLERVWVDGFAEFSPQELGLLQALAGRTGEMTVTLCLDEVPPVKPSWLSSWSVTRQAFRSAEESLSRVPGVQLEIEILRRDPERNRFPRHGVLAHLEERWAEPTAWVAANGESIDRALRVVACPDPEGEAVVAAREILAYVRKGGRFREAAVLVRKLEAYHEVLHRTLVRYEIPFFLDRRESVAHHPLAELTRNALRTLNSGWRHEDWFAALKTGLLRCSTEAIDELENEALARGWKGETWARPLKFNEPPSPGEAESTRRARHAKLERLRQELTRPFLELSSALGGGRERVTGPELAEAIRRFWKALGVEGQLRAWAEDPAGTAEEAVPAAVHATVWEQMNSWLSNVDGAFTRDALTLREWLPILEAGLSNLAVGVIPPGLDQVLIGSIDRSRNPGLKLAVILGLNETVFPALPESAVLLTEADREELAAGNVKLGAGTREQLARERHWAYLAFTRAQERLVLTRSLHDSSGTPLNPSPFLAHLRRLFPGLEEEAAPEKYGGLELLAPCELVTGLLPRWATGGDSSGSAFDMLAEIPAVARVLSAWRQLRDPALDEALSPEAADGLYGPVLISSVSRLENFAACPFKFFVHSGLRVEDRKRFEPDVREQGSFQHDVLAAFHEQLRKEGKRWRDLEPEQAAGRIGEIARERLGAFREGLMTATAESRFLARMLTEALQRFVAVLVGWMRTQYTFDPVAVELPFGEATSEPFVQLGDGHGLRLRGRIDRVDLARVSDQAAFCVVMDYKSSGKKLDPVMMAHGLQLQLLAYLSVVWRWPDPQRTFGFPQLIPAGVFYVNLRGGLPLAENRRAALDDPDEARKHPYRHTGRFDAAALRALDARTDAVVGDQFNYRLNKSGELSRSGREGLETAEFNKLLIGVESTLKRMALEIFAGSAAVSPFRKGTFTACRNCDYGSICRFDPWQHAFRVPREDAPSPGASGIGAGLSERPKEAGP